MPLLNCPDTVKLLEFISIPQEMPKLLNFELKVHTQFCKSCRTKMSDVQKTWQAYLKPSPEITPSLIKVFSKLKSDETLILKGWKLGEVSHKPALSNLLFNQGWLFRGTVSLGIGIAALLVVMTQIKEPPQVAQKSNKLPFAQIRMEDKNRVQVRYVQPELLQTIEFETRGR